MTTTLFSEKHYLDNVMDGTINQSFIVIGLKHRNITVCLHDEKPQSYFHIDNFMKYIKTILHTEMKGYREVRVINGDGYKVYEVTYYTAD